MLVPALAGARRAVEQHAVTGAVDGEFVDSAARMIQRAVAEYIDGSDRHRLACGGDGAHWATARFPRQVFAAHAGASAASDPALLTALRARAVAIDTLVAAHTRLIRSLLAAQRGRGQDDPDMLQRAFLALRRAAEGFDPDRHPRFAPLARTVVMNEFENARRENSGASASGCRLVAEFVRARARLADRPAGPPTVDEVFESLAWSQTKRENYRRAVSAAPTDPADDECQSRRRRAENPLEVLIAREEDGV